MERETYTLELDDQNGLVRVIARGELDRDLGDEIITRARSAAAEHGYDIFCDVRTTTANVTLADWFFLPRRLGIFQQKGMRRVRVAVLISAGDQEAAYRFYQTVSTNLGFNVRIFTSEHTALQWLNPDA